MPTIDLKMNRVTQINVFMVKPENQQALVDLLIESANFVRAIPEWISASIHVSQDGTKVVNYAQCENMEAALRVIDALKKEGFLDRNKLLGEAHPGLYRVVATVENS